jgi:chemosensory pili system protein ChpA (sensor histidine kinase/response regulator)
VPEEVSGGLSEQVVAELPEEVTAEAGDVETVDSEILEIFGEEANEELESIQACYPKWRSEPDDSESLQTMRRSFHTLKGSGRIVGANNIGEFSWAVENLLNRVIDGTVQRSSEILQFMDEVVAALPQLVEECQRLDEAGTDVSRLSERAFALASGETVVETAEATGPAAGPEPTSPEEAPIEVVAEPAGVVAVDEVAASELPEEADDLAVASVGGAYQQPVFGLDGDSVSAELATVSLGAGEPGLRGSPDISFEPVTDEAGQESMVVQAESADESILSDGEAQDSEFSQFESTTLGVADSSLNSVFLNETGGHLAVLAEFIERSRSKSVGTDFDADLRRAMHTLRGSSRAAGVSSMAELAAALEDFTNVMHSQHRHTDPSSLDLLDRSHKMLLGLAETVEQPHAVIPDWESLRDQISVLVSELTHETSEPQVTPAPQEELDPELLEIFLEEAKELLDALESELSDWEAAVDNPSAVAKLQRTLHTIKGGARLTGVAAVGDLSHAMESVFESVTERRVVPSERLSGLVRHAADALAQCIEQLFQGVVPGSHPAMITRLEAAAKGLEWDDVAAIEAAIPPAEKIVVDVEPEASPEPESQLSPAPESLIETQLFESHEPDADSELLADSQLLTDSELLTDSGFLPEQFAAVAEAAPVGEVVEKDSTVVQFPGAEERVGEEGEGFVARRPFPEEEPTPAVGHERVRVSSEALDQMVNNAGEVSIYRARLEQQNSSAAFNLGELQQTTDRLRSQLRDLELETEAQIHSRHEREGETRADFDPLEMDRYSTMQQLSRALSETVEDLSNLGQSLSELSRDTDTLLLQQARVTTDLQDSLLRTRMVKFSSRVPRLERVVRQTSHSVGKQANLDVIGGEEDMDRAILERMMSPLEHLLRNAVSHGIEDTNTRLANGKAPQGVITLHLAREGADVVLTLSDNGAGLDRARIRSKAVERGLIEADAPIDDDDLYQLILQPGFSTAEELSQLSGRGVGMDVVLTEVKQLGGTLEIDSQPGYGTGFTIRLPFTLAITDSLLVTQGDEIYAVPHSSMDGVVRISLDELRAIYAGDQEVFRYGDRDYNVRYLGSMLGTEVPHLNEAMKWLPLLLVRSGEHRVAIQVDGLLGNRQIVVKSIGAQLSTVRWFTGGTILADGQIALILDVNSLVRMDSAAQPITASSAPAPVSKGVSVMVVDDSITVRKVTSRLLERHNMQVVTAKDGVDAVTLLQENHPDVMLLDIEMPRMDGYELARHMRSTPELSDIPIIMITSRTGDKHRKRAQELGVRRYLGKPYQEADLLENIYTVLADSAL